MSAAEVQLLLSHIASAGPKGLTPEVMGGLVPGISRSTLNRRLAEFLSQGLVLALGAGRARRYVSASTFSRAEIDAFFDQPWQQRPVAPFNEALLLPSPELADEKAQRCTQIQALAQPIDRHFLASFVVDFSWGSSVLEGGTYSSLDTQTLIQYGQQNKSKPMADALLVLNHKRAAEYLWENRTLSFDNACAMHALLTDEHGLPDVLSTSDHFLPAHQRGQPREYEDVNLAASAYIPPSRPGTGFVAAALKDILLTAGTLKPVAAALYLMTRIPYLQAFANGNKRTSRILANVPLLAAGLLPISFADVDKADYIRGMAAFYELGSLYLIEQTFLAAYAKSIVRSSQIPLGLRVRGFDIDAAAAALLAYINSGQRPKDKTAVIFLGA